MPKQARVFVSHSHQDNEYCREYVAGLRTAGCSVWYDEHNLGWGELRTTIESELEQSQHFVAILSPASVASQWVNREVDAAIRLADEGKLLSIVFVLAARCTIPLLLGSWKRIEGPGGGPVTVSEAVEKTLRIVGMPSPSQASRTHASPTVVAPQDVPSIAPPVVVPQSRLPIVSYPAIPDKNTDSIDSGDAGSSHLLRPNRSKRLLLVVTAAVLMMSLGGVLLTSSWIEQRDQKTNTNTPTRTPLSATLTRTPLSGTSKIRLPYSAVAPGPNCDKGNIPWQTDNPSHLHCLADRTHVTGSATMWWGDFTNQLPEDFTMSIKAGNFGQQSASYPQDDFHLAIFATIGGTSSYAEYSLDEYTDHTAYFSRCIDGTNCGPDDIKVASSITSGMQVWTIHFSGVSASVSLNNHVVGSVSDAPVIDGSVSDAPVAHVYRVVIAMDTGDIADWKITAP